MKFLKSDQQDGVGVSLTPLVDIIFLLIIFFLVSSTFEKGEKTLGIQLPQTQGENANTNEPKSWEISITRANEVYYQGQKSSFDEVEKILKRNKGRQDEIEVVIKADQKSEFGMVASFIGLLKQNGYDKVSFRFLDTQKT